MIDAIKLMTEDAKEKAAIFLYQQGYGYVQIARVTGYDLDRVALILKDVSKRRSERAG